MHRMILPRSSALTGIASAIVALCVIAAGCQGGPSGATRSQAPAPTPGVPASDDEILPPTPRPMSAAELESIERDRWSQVTKTGRIDLRLGQYEQAEANFLVALQISERFRRSDVRRRVSLSNLDRLARTYESQGQKDSFARVARHIAKSSAGFDGGSYPELSALLYDLGIFDMQADRLDESARVLEQALQIRIDEQGHNANSLQEIYAALAQVFVMQSNFERAAPLAERRLALAEANAALDPGDLISSLMQVAAIRDEQRRLDEVEALYDRALELQMKRNPEALELAMIYNARATFYLHSGRPAEARSAIVDALAVADAHDTRGIFLANLLETDASIHAALGQRELADEKYRAAIAEASDAPARQRAPLLESYEAFLRDSGRADDADRLKRSGGVVETKAPEETSAPVAQGTLDAEEIVPTGTGAVEAPEPEAREAAPPVDDGTSPEAAPPVEAQWDE